MPLAIKLLPFKRSWKSYRAHKTQERCCTDVFFCSSAFFTKVHLLVEARVHWSVTQTIMWLSHFLQTLQCPHLCLTVSFSLSPSISLSQVQGCSRRCHMMSCGPVVVAEQWQFYPSAIWSTCNSLSHAQALPAWRCVCVCVFVWASLYDHKSGQQQ